MTKNFTDFALAFFRISISGMMLVHGIPKIERLFSSPIEFGDPIGVGPTLSLILALIGEVIAPLFIIVGFKTKLAAIPAAITMFVAAFIVHLEDDFGTKEKALLYLVCFIVIFLAGPGKYAIDNKK
ncbi:DoxX family protein [Xanthomarina spongicola]|uniref:Putative oxidoreductase n=1 Tax=Xanthomarina spongicola TaxID=570520 RepID=A0A316DND9_9FLAO|nr:DoxX family protein [Xanthomarina spongicola]PWK19574.1 putative oxidoreductase [Xanthomarina spongicola]